MYSPVRPAALLTVIACLSTGASTVPVASAARDERFGASPGARAAAEPRPARANPLSSHFEPNAGQTDPRVAYLARSAGYTLFLSSSEAVFSIATPAGRGEAAPAAAAVRMRFAGSGGTPFVEGELPLPGESNYFVGDDPAGWRTEVPHFGRVRYRDLYPGTDLLFYFEDGAVEYDFVVAPGQSPGAILLDFDGAESVEVDGSGALVLATRAGALRHLAPVCYQEAPEGGRRRVAGRYVKSGPTSVGFELGGYDPSRPLVIDPIVEYSTVLGQGSAQSVALDGDGNLVVVGSAGSADFPTVDPIQPYREFDAFVAKLDPTGTTLLFSTFYGGTGIESADAVALGASGDLHFAGRTSSTDLPTVGPLQAENAGGYDAFVAKLAASGSSLLYSTYVGGAANDFAYAVDVSGAGEAFVTGETDSTDFPTVSPIQTDPDPQQEDAFVSKISASGSSLVYSTYLGGPDDPDVGYGIAVDAEGHAYVAGYASPGIPTTPGAFQPQGGFDAFVAKLAPSGTSLVYSTHLGGGGGGSSVARAIAVDGLGHAYVTGSTNADNFPTLNAAQPQLGSNIFTTDAFVTKLNPAGSGLVYSTYLGAGEYDEARAIAVDATGSAYVTGFTYSFNFPAEQPVYGRTNSGPDSDTFVTRVSPSGSAWLYSTIVRDSRAQSIAVDAGGAAYVAGFAFGTFPTLLSLQDGVATGGFVMRLSAETALDTAGVYAPSSGAWFVKNANEGGAADAAFFYGAAGAGLVPVAGDWDGDGRDTAGLYDPATGFFFLRNSNEAGPADLAFSYGPAGLGWVPVVGDWNGDGRDTVGLYDPSAGFFFLKDTNADGPADLTFSFGPAGDAGWVPLAGDWNDDAVDTIGLYDPVAGAFFLRNANFPGPADLTFVYGAPGSGWTPLAGDWDRDGQDTVGLYAPSTGFFFLRNANEPGPADATFSYGAPGATPLAGDWDGR